MPISQLCVFNVSKRMSLLNGLGQCLLASPTVLHGTASGHRAALLISVDMVCEKCHWTGATSGVWCVYLWSYLDLIGTLADRMTGRPLAIARTPRRICLSLRHSTSISNARRTVFTLHVALPWCSGSRTRKLHRVHWRNKHPPQWRPSDHAGSINRHARAQEQVFTVFSASRSLSILVC